MNRTVPRSLPLKLQCLLEEQLSPEKLLYITLWTASVLNRSIHADVLHGAIACLEDQLHAAGDDLEFDACIPSLCPCGLVRRRRMSCLSWGIIYRLFSALPCLDCMQRTETKCFPLRC